MSDPSDPIRITTPPRNSADRKRKLGRGLGALLGETQREEPLTRGRSDGGDTDSHHDGAVRGGLASIATSAIEPLPGQPRRRFDEDALEDRFLDLLDDELEGRIADEVESEEEDAEAKIYFFHFPTR